MSFEKFNELVKADKLVYEFDESILSDYARYSKSLEWNDRFKSKVVATQTRALLDCFEGDADSLNQFSRAFTLLSQYAVNLSLYPWKFKDASIKTYTGAFTSYLLDWELAVLFLESMGYKKNEKDHSWDFSKEEVDSLELMSIAYSLHVAALECQIIFRYHEKNKQSTLSQCCQFRMETKGQTTFRVWLKEDHNRREQPMETDADTHDDLVASPASIQTRGADWKNGREKEKEHTAPQISDLRHSSANGGDKSLLGQVVFECEGCGARTVEGDLHCQTCKTALEIAPKRQTVEKHGGLEGDVGKARSPPKQSDNRWRCDVCKHFNEFHDGECRNCKLKAFVAETSVAPLTVICTPSGDWTCPKCHKQYDQYDKGCRRCNLFPTLIEQKSGGNREHDEKEKYLPVRRGSEGGWSCPKYTTTNERSRSHSDSREFKPIFEDEKKSGETSTRQSVRVRRDSDGKWKCTECSKWNGGVKCYGCTFAPDLEVTREYTGSGFRTPQGGWIAERTGLYWCCTNCKGENYNDLEVCGTCKIAPRFLDNKHGLPGRIAVQKTPTVRRDSTGKWTCPECSKLNGGIVCYNCSVVPVFEVTSACSTRGVGTARGDWDAVILKMNWYCANCKSKNFESEGVCYKCKIAPRSITTTSTPVREKLSVHRNSTGQWQCPKCNNWKSDRECYECKVLPSFDSTPEDAVAGDEKRREGRVVQRDIEGAWSCPECHRRNRKTDDECYWCKMKPSFIEKKPKVCQKCNMANPNSTYCKSCYTVLK